MSNAAEVILAVNTGDAAWFWAKGLRALLHAKEEWETLKNTNVFWSQWALDSQFFAKIKKVFQGDALSENLAGTARVEALAEAIGTESRRLLAMHSARTSV